MQTLTWGASEGALLLLRGLPLVLLAVRVEGAGVAPLPCTASGSSDGACMPASTWPWLLAVHLARGPLFRMAGVVVFLVAVCQEIMDSCPLG